MQSKPKSLVIISPGFPKDEAETTCMPTQQWLIRSINRHFPDIQIIILTLYHPGFKAEYYWFGNRVISFNGRNKNKISRLFTWIKVWRKLLRIKREWNIIGLLSFWATESAVIGDFFGKIYGIKHFTWLLGQDAKADNKYIRFYKPSPESLIAISNSLADLFHKNHGIKPKHIIYNGIETSLFPAKKPVKNVDILGAGALIPLKQYHEFINIVAEIKQVFPDIKACICGGGPEEKNLRMQIRKLGLETNIELTGTLQHIETLQRMQEAKVFLHTSIYEGFSTACLEALYAGAHVISFCYPLEEKIQHWHVVKSTGEMIEKTIEILTDPAADFSSVSFQTIDEAAIKIMRLFH